MTGQYEECILGPGVNPVWSQDEQWLAFQRSFKEAAPLCLVIEARTCEATPLDVPIAEKGRLVDWVPHRYRLPQGEGGG